MSASLSMHRVATIEVRDSLSKKSPDCDQYLHTRMTFIDNNGVEIAQVEWFADEGVRIEHLPFRVT